jgi:hypothetical protein
MDNTESGIGVCPPPPPIGVGSHQAVHNPNGIGIA